MDRMMSLRVDGGASYRICRLEWRVNKSRKEGRGQIVNYRIGNVQRSSIDIEIKSASTPCYDGVKLRAK